VSFVVDNSVALAWCFEDEHTPPIMDLLDRVAETGAVAPSLWPLEALNGLLMAERKKRLDTRRRQRLAGFLRSLAERHRLTLYDAAYLELAQRRKLPLATLDVDLIKAGKALGMTLLGT
jgi:predicted nucleic acid-binding protein